MDSSISITPTSSSSIYQQQPSINSDNRKKESFKQQFKRLVGWGSSYNVKKQATGTLPPPITTTSNSSYLNSPSDVSFASTPSTPFPPTPGTLSSVAASHKKSKHYPVHDIMELNTPVSIASKQPSVVVHSMNNPSLTGLSSTASLTTSSKIVSNHSSLSSVSSTSSVTSEELIAAAAKNQHIDEEDEVEDDDHATEKEEVIAPPIIAQPQEEEKEQQTIQATPLPSEEGDIQMQYAMWMTTNAAVPEETISPETHSPIISPPPTTPVTHSATTTTHEEPVMTTPPPPISSSHKSSIMSNNTIEPSTLSMSSGTTATDEEHQSDMMHPMSSGQEVDDLFLLVAHGVEFLTSRENSQWEEYGGYDFHPWNRPHGSFSVVRQQQRNKTTQHQQLPLQSSHETTEVVNPSNDSQQQQLLEEDKDVATVETKLEQVEQEAATPQQEIITQKEEESPSALAKRILGAKPEAVKTPSLTQTQPQQHPSVDDEVII